MDITFSDVVDLVSVLTLIVALISLILTTKLTIWNKLGDSHLNL